MGALSFTMGYWESVFSLSAGGCVGPTPVPANGRLDILTKGSGQETARRAARLPIQIGIGIGIAIDLFGPRRLRFLMPAATQTALLDCPVSLARAALRVPGRAMTIRLTPEASSVVRPLSSFFGLLPR